MHFSSIQNIIKIGQIIMRLNIFDADSTCCANDDRYKNIYTRYYHEL